MAKTRCKRKNMHRRSRSRSRTRKYVQKNKQRKGGMCPCFMRGGDGIGAPTTEKADGVPVPPKGLVDIPGLSDSMDIKTYKEYFSDVLDGKIVPESQDF